MIRCKNDPRTWRKRKGVDYPISLSKPRLSFSDFIYTHTNSTEYIENSSDFPTLLLLPNEILIYIMRYLDCRSIIYFSRSCLRCYSLGYDYSIWRMIQINIQLLSNQFLIRWGKSYILHLRCSNVRSLYLTGTQTWELKKDSELKLMKLEYLSKLLLSMRNLVSITIDSFAFDLQALSIFGKFPLINYLKFSNISFSFHFFREFNLKSAFPNLTTLAFDLCPKLCIQSIEFLTNHDNLTKLYIDGCYRVSHIDYMTIVRTHQLFNQRCKCFLDGEHIL